MTGTLRFILLILFLFGISACGKGNAKIQLTPEDVTNLKNASQVYIVDYPSPEFAWWFHNSGYFPFPSGGDRKYSLKEAKERLNKSFFFNLDDPAITLRQKVSDFAKTQIGFTNIKHTSNSFMNDNPMNLKKMLGPGKVIEIKTDFWHLFPTYSRQSLNPEETSYQFQYSGFIRFVDLDTVSVIHQHSCHYPSKTEHVGQWLQPEASSLLDVPTWENAMSVPELIDQQGANIRIQIQNAVTHCLEEFEKLFPE